MLEWLRLLSMIFYAPERGLREVRDRAALAPAGLVALLAQILFLGLLTWLFLPSISPRHSLTVLSLIFQSAGFLLFIAIVFVPLAVLVVNLIQRRGSYRLVMQQEYSAVAATIFYSWAASCLIALLLTLAGKFSGVLPKIAEGAFNNYMQQQPQVVFGFQKPD